MDSGNEVTEVFLRIERQHHLGAKEVLRVEEILMHRLTTDDRCERHPEVALLDHSVDDSYEILILGVSQDGTIAQCSGTELHSSFTTCNRVVRNKNLSSEVIPSTMVFGTEDESKVLFAS